MIPFVLTECVQLLEQRLGIVSTDASRLSAEGPTTEDNNNRSRRNPFTFLVDFFKPKKGRSDTPDSTMIHKEEGDGSNRTALLQEENNPSVDTQGSNGALNSDGICVSPHKQINPEVIESLEKIQISREDNPTVQQHIRKLSSDSRSSVHDSPKIEAGASCLTIHSDSESSTVDYSHLIRSPPPALKRESLSPVRNPLLTPRSEVSPHQV